MVRQNRCHKSPWQVNLRSDFVPFHPMHYPIYRILIGVLAPIAVYSTFID
jgi:hypothetical protein